MSKNKAGSVVVALLGLCIMSACGISPPARYYLLTPQAVSVSRAGALGTVAVGVGPIRFPEYLNRPQFVTRQGASGLEIDEFHRWAEPLSSSFTAVLANNIALGTGSGQIFVFPWTGKLEIGYRVLAEVTRFDVDAGGLAVLEVQWGIVGPDDAILVPADRARYTETSTPGDYTSAVNALNAMVAEFAADVTQALAGLAGAG